MKRSNGVAAAGEAEWDKPELLSEQTSIHDGSILFAWPWPWAPDHLLQVCLHASTDLLLTPTVTHLWNKSLMPRCSGGLHPQLWHFTVMCLQTLADTRIASPKETRLKKLATTFFFFFGIPSRVTQYARFICGRCCNTERCWLSSYFSHLDIH